MADSPAHRADVPPASAGWRSALRQKLDELKQLPAWLRRNPLRGIAVMSVVIGLPLALLTLGVYFLPKPEFKRRATIEEALQALDDGNFEQARKYALEVKGSPSLTYSNAGGPLYVIGMALAHDAHQQWNREQRVLLCQAAARFLEEARSYDFPEGRAAEGNLTMGHCYHEAGEPAKAIAALWRSIEEGTPQPALSEWLLAESYRRLDPPQLEKALEHVTRLLELESLSPLERQKAELLQARIELALGNIANCREILEGIPASSSLAGEATTIKGQMLIAEGDRIAAKSEDKPQQAIDLYLEAIEALRSVPAKELERDPPTDAQFLLGICYLRLDDFSAAEAQFSRVRRLHDSSVEKLPSSFEEAKLLARRREYAEAVQLTVKTLREADASGRSYNPWVSTTQIQQQVSELWRQLIDADQFATALELTDLPPGWISPWQVTLWKAETYVARAADSEREAARSPLEKAEALRNKTRADHRQAAEYYAQLAEQRQATRSFSDDLWLSAEQYSAGRDYRRCVAALRSYLQNESKRRRPDALLLLGESLLAMNQVDAALETLQECIDTFPKHPATYRARLLMAQAFAERGLLADARRSVALNVESDELSPRATEWRDSLFLLGQLLYREGMEFEAKSRAAGIDGEDLDRVRIALAPLEQSHQAFRQAIEHLEKAVLRYPDAPQAKQARFILADSYRQSAKWPRKRMRVGTIEAMRAAYTRQSHQDLQAAVQRFDKLIAALGEIQESPNHTLLDKQLLRNCYFAKADALYDMADYDEALRAYSAATNRYQNHPESLQAYVQIAACYRRLDRLAEARGTLQQAKIILSRMKDDTDFTRTTPYTRAEWDQLLTWLATL
jgi:tetratricopeptide (TPR) repeat protein